MNILIFLSLFSIINASCLSITGFTRKTGVFTYEKGGIINRKPIEEIRKGNFILSYNQNSRYFEPVEVSHIEIIQFYGVLSNISFYQHKFPIDNSWNIEYCNLRGKPTLDLNTNPIIHYIYSVPTQLILTNNVKNHLDFTPIGLINPKETTMYPDFLEGFITKNIIENIGRVHVMNEALYNVHLKQPKNEQYSYLTDIGFAPQPGC
jgi:hypothetical protein